MAHPRDSSYLRFGCPRCMARLKARPSQAGSERRCPRCQFKFTVPDAEQAARLAVRPEEYTIRSGDAPIPEVDDLTIRLECPVCRTQIYATEDLIGQTLECPDCGTLVPVAPARELHPKVLPDFGIDEYVIHEGPAPPREAEEANIPVYCPVCNTLMYGTLDQVGRELLCPDCYTPVRVPPPPERVAKPVHSVTDDYALREEPKKPAEPGAAGGSPSRAPVPAAPKPEEVEIPVVCYLCHTRMYAALDQVGQRIICPDCGAGTVVPTLEQARPQYGPTERPIGDYGVGQAVERKRGEVPVDTRQVRLPPKAKPGAAQPSEVAPGHPALPEWPLVSGVWNFPFYSETWPRLLGLTLGLIALLPLVVVGLLLVAPPPDSFWERIPGDAAAIIFAGCAVFVTVWWVVACSRFRAVIEDTAAGNDQIENWPESTFVDWLFDCLDFASSLLISPVPGILVLQFTAMIGLPVAPAVLVSMFSFFPVVLLSTIETGSPLKPVSFVILGSLFSVPWAWGLFYVQTGVLLVAFFVFAWLAFALVGLWGLLPMALVLPWACMIYFRLLGRVGWYCTEAVARHDAAEAEEHAADDEPVRRRAPAPEPAPPDRVDKPPVSRAEPVAPRERAKPSRSILDDDWDG